MSKKYDFVNRRSNLERIMSQKVNRLGLIRKESRLSKLNNILNEINRR